MKRSVGALVGLALLASARLASAACAGRPTDAGGVQGYTYGAAEVRSHATTRARVHYAISGSHAPNLASTRGDGVPDTVAFAAETAEDALKRFSDLGFRAPPSDAACPSNGGDARVDVYLVDFAGADGATISESCSGRACASFVLVDATFTGRGYRTPNEGFSTVVTHELFHAVQNAYDAQLDRFWAEGTAQWAMKVLHPELPDFEHQLPAFFAEPHRSIDTQPSGVTAGFLYGSSVFPLYLELAHGEGFVRAVLEAQASGQKAVPAIEAVLVERGSSLADAYPMFGAWNAATKKYAGTGGYPDAAEYPGVKVLPLEDGVSGLTSGLAYHAYATTLDGLQQVSLETDATRNAGVLVPLEGGKARLDRATKLPANAEGDVLVVVAGITSKKTDAPFTVRVGAPEPAGEPGADGGEPTAASTPTAGDDGGCGVAGARTRSSGPSLGVGMALLAVAATLSRRRR